MLELWKEHHNGYTAWCQEGEYSEDEERGCEMEYTRCGLSCKGDCDDNNDDKYETIQDLCRTPELKTKNGTTNIVERPYMDQTEWIF